MTLPSEHSPTDLIEQRKKKLEAIAALGHETYPHQFEYTTTATEILAQHALKDRDQLAASRVDVKICGRLLTLRFHGKAAFAHLSDGQSKVQIYVRLDSVGEKNFQLFQLFDLGDLIGVEGYLFRTKTNELTVHVDRCVFLAKALLPLPEKWHGLHDVELRYRQRYLDLIVNPHVREVFEKRSRIIQYIRDFLNARSYLEVETPMMQPLAGGAVARPFKTFHHALGIDLYLRIAPELYLKRLLVGGLNRVYEINRNFRNEGISTQHNPEFTMLEFYQAYSDYRDLMGLTEELLTGLCQSVAGSLEVEYDGHRVNFARPWARFTMREAVVKFWPREFGLGEITLSEISDAQSLRRVCQRYEEAYERMQRTLSESQASAHTGTAASTSPDEAALAKRFIEEQGFRSIGSREVLDAMSYGHLLGALFEVVAERHLIQPTFISEFPIELSPLSKRNQQDARFVDRFELFIAGMECANAFSELNDPTEQRRRFEEQLKLRERGDQEAHGMDEDYLRALSYGMPPAAGEGIGIDRLVMVLSNSKSIRDVILFPHMRPEKKSES